jgi:hypothetical protein
MVPAVGNPDLNRDDRRGLVIFPAAGGPRPQRGDWWLVAVALIVAGVMIAVAFAVR